MKPIPTFEELFEQYKKENKGLLYCGIFKYSPNAKKVTLYKETDKQFQQLFNSELKSLKKRIKKIEERFTTQPEYIEDHKEDLEKANRELHCLFVKKENMVFYVADLEYNILFETHNIFHKGNFTDEVKDAMKKYGLNTKDLRTDSTLEDLKFDVKMDIELKQIAKNLR